MIEDPEIAWLREEIDALDRELLALIHKRLEKVLLVGERKREKGLAVYDPAREARLLDHLTQKVQAPVDAALVREVFQTLVQQCRRIEIEHQ